VRELLPVDPYTHPYVAEVHEPLTREDLIECDDEDYATPENVRILLDGDITIEALNRTIDMTIEMFSHTDWHNGPQYTECTNPMYLAWRSALEEATR